MKAFLATAAVLFGLVTLVHIWRMIVEPSVRTDNPWVMIMTVISAILFVWACVLLRRSGIESSKGQ